MIKHFKEAACRIGVSKRTSLFQALFQHCDENWMSMKVTSMSMMKLASNHLCVLLELVGFVVTDVCYSVK